MQLRIREDDSGWEMIYKQTRTMRWEAGLNARGGVYTWHHQISCDLDKTTPMEKENVYLYLTRMGQ